MIHPWNNQRAQRLLKLPGMSRTLYHVQVCSTADESGLKH